MVTEARVTIDPVLRDPTLEARSSNGAMLSVSCARRGGAQVYLDTARPLTAPAPADGATATLSIGRAPPRSVRLGWMTDPVGAWTMRDAAEARDVAAAVAAAEAVSVTMPDIYPGEVFAWHILLPPLSRERLGDACSPPQAKASASPTA